jgi:hypothetical protein
VVIFSLFTYLGCGLFNNQYASHSSSLVLMRKVIKFLFLPMKPVVDRYQNGTSILELSTEARLSQERTLTSIGNKQLQG